MKIKVDNKNKIIAFKCTIIAIAVGVTIFCAYNILNIITNYDSILKNYIDGKASVESRNFFGMSIKTSAMYFENQLMFSILGLIIAFFFILLALFLIFYYAKQFFLYSTCKNYTIGHIEYDGYRYVLNYKDFEDNMHESKVDYHKKEFARIYRKHNKEVKVYLNYLTPNDYILNSRKSFLKNTIKKPLKETIRGYLLIIIMLIVLNPFLVLSII